MSNRRLFLLVLFLLLAAAARLYRLPTQSIWFDEGWSAYAAEQPSLAAAWNADATNPPLYYVLLNVAARGFGTSEFGLRSFSLLTGLLTIPLVERLARRAGGSRAGLIAALLAAVSAPLWWASQEARMYTLLALLILICALAWQQTLRRPTRAAWLALWLGELALLYAHNTGPVAALWLNLAALIVGLRRRGGFPWRTWIAGQAGVGLLWLPYFVTRFLLLQGANSAVTSAPALSPLLLGQVWLGFWIAPWPLAVAALTPLTVLALLSLVIALITLRRRALALLGHVVVLTVGLIAGLIVLGNDLHGRYLIMIVPLLLAALGVGIAGLRDRRLRLLALLPFPLLFLLDVIAAQNPDYQHDDARAMVQYYADHLSADDTVIAWSYADRYDLAYYWARLGVRARRVTLPEGADLDAVLPLLRPDGAAPGGDVALNVWYTQRADYRGMLGCLLGAGTTTAPTSVTVYGMTTLIYHQPTLDPPAWQPAVLTFRDSGGQPVAQLDAYAAPAAVTPDRALCLPLALTLPRALSVDLKAALIVQNALGWTVASADAVFATANQRTTSAAAPGEPLTAYPLLRLPYGAPPGDYAIYLRIYDESAAPSGYEPPSANAPISGRDVRLTTWTVLPGADWSRSALASDLPNRRDLALADDLTLLADDAHDGTLVNGDELRVTLLWQGSGSLPDVELADVGGAWRVTAAASGGAHDTIVRDWRALRVPPAAASGTAELRVGGQVLARYQIDALPLLTTAPAFSQPVHALFPGVGELVGFTLDAPPLSLDTPPRLTLVWQAGERAAPVSYTVFAQLIGDDGRVIAQSDAIPGGRPTTGWRAGEYILDEQTLHYNDGAQPSRARLIVGLYDAAGGARVRLSDGTDAVTLATDLEIR